MEMQDLTDKVAVITGASSGFGEAAARRLVAEGVQVVLAARREQLIVSLAEALGPKATAIATDVTDPDQVTALFSFVKEQFGGLDLLFNNAGLGIYGEFESSTAADRHTMIDVNVHGVFDCTQAAIPLMKGRRGAMISTVSSTAGRYGVNGWSVYCASKHAVVGFHEALRKELGEDGIRVSLIEPGAAWTEFGHNIPGDALNERREAIEALQADDVAQALVYTFAQHPRVLVQDMMIRPVKQVAP